ncbi:MAG: hypothetical protein P8Z40_13210 [Chloroflexota bacterium]
MNQVTLRCGRCGREAGPEMLGCPERPLGACPYELHQQVAARMKGSLGCLVIASALASITAVMLGLSAGWLWAGAIELILLGGVLLWLLARRKTLLDPATGATWQRVALLGAELDRVVIPRLDQLDLCLEPYKPLMLPSSVAALTNESGTPHTEAYHSAMQAGWEKRVADLPKPPSWDGVYMLTAAFAGLLAAGAVEVYQGQLLKRGFKLRRLGMADQEETVYLVRSGAGAEAACGALEERIVERLRGWGARSEAVRWPFGPPIYDLVYVLFDADKSTPGRWLASLAVDDATERGLGRMVKGSNGEAAQRPPKGMVERVVRLVERLAGHFEIDPDAQHLMDAQHEVVLDLIDQLEDADRDFVAYFRAEAGRAIEARHEKSSD